MKYQGQCTIDLREMALANDPRDFLFSKLREAGIPVPEDRQASEPFMDEKAAWEHVKRGLKEIGATHFEAFQEPPHDRRIFRWFKDQPI